MLFNSLAFLVFLPLAFAAYWAAQGRLRLQNVVVLAVSYLFYGWWDWRFLGLIVVSSAVDYTIGILLSGERPRRVRRLLVSLSLLVNLGLLGFFKYFNFFAESLSQALAGVGLTPSTVTLEIVLPVGISFYTFQTLSYTIDVYRRNAATCRDPLAFFAYVSFFPQLVAGPIERATRLLPQFENARSFDEEKAVDGLRQILWGFFKKVAVADTCALMVDQIFADYGSFSGVSLAFAAFLFAIQIYGDFSGYSDIAIGTGRLFGIGLMRNFANPYFSRDIAEFWRRWHISLSTWFRDYVYVPLGGSRVGSVRALRNIVIVFVVSGFWHGANWTFIAWGALNALLFVPLFVMSKNRAHLDTVAAGRWLPTNRETLQMGTTFAVTTLAWVFFRAPSVGDAVGYLGHMVTADPIHPLKVSTTAFGLAVSMLAWEWLQREREHGLEISWMPALARRATYMVVLLATIKFAGSQQAFIYFQF